MPSFHALVILMAAFSSLFSITAQSSSSFPSSSSSCNKDFFIHKFGRNITNCKKLETLGAEFGWNLYNDANKTVDIWFGLKTLGTIQWVAWGVNPLPMAKMVGTRALIAILQPNGSHVLNTYNITVYTKMGCRLQPSPIELTVHRNAVFTNELGFLAMSATLAFPQEYNLSNLNHVWQVGSRVVGLEPQMHARTLQNVDSAETIDLTTGKSRNAGHHRRHLRSAHGFLNTIGWGTLLPIGVIIARYFREFPFRFPQMCFKLHISCQIMGFTIGTAGWATGILLGNASKYYKYTTHRILGIFIFTFTVLQMLALWLKPNKKDEFRKYWDIYHHFLGYALIVVIIVNIFHGIHILRPDEKWKWAYVAVLGLLGLITLALEIFTWIKFIYEKHIRN